MFFSSSWCKASRFQASRAGSIGVAASVGAGVLIVSVGAAVDFHQANRTQSRLQDAADAAVLGATNARELSDDQRAARAVNIFLANVAKVPTISNVNPVANFASGTASVTANADYKTTFLRVAGITKLPVSARSTAVTTGKKIEMTLVTDITGSMAETRNGSTKIDGLKTAAKDMLDIVMPGSTQSDDFRVALVPFANYVNAGTYAPTVTGLDPTRNNRGSTKYLISCVTERTGTQAYTDAAPASGQYVGGVAQGNSIANYDSNGGCDRSSGGNGGAALPSIIPLTSDKTKLVNQINSLTPGGSTAGHLGTAWGWYMLSPRWNGIWNLSTPIAEYSDDKVMKVVVILTDGEYNTQYSSTSSSQQALSVCTAMKTAGVTVFTVGFGFDASNSSDNAAKQLLTQCASGTGHYFFPYDGDALRQTFMQIGDTVNSAGLKARLSQ